MSTRAVEMVRRYLPDNISALRGEVAVYRAASFSSRTKKTYSAHLSTHLQFCESLDLAPVRASKDQVYLRAAYLARSMKPTSVRQYLNIIRIHTSNVVLLTRVQTMGHFSLFAKE